MNFGGLPLEYCSFTNSHFVVVPVPYDLTSSYQSGARRGPAAILEASANMELYDEELEKETYLCGIHTRPFMGSIASGPMEMVQSVQGEVAEVLDTGKVPVILGGDHSISLGAVRAMKEKFPRLSVLQLDAHADLRDTYQGTPYSHACVGRRISEISTLVQAGIRSLSSEEAQFLKTSVVWSISPEQLRGRGMKKKICESFKTDVYITIDIDVLDPSIMPSTGTPEPGGLLWHEVLKLIREVSQRCSIRGIDIVELAPIPGIIAPDFLVSKLAYRIMGYMTERK